MFKKLIALFFLFSLYTISLAQVTFDLDFTFSKIDPEDELVSLQLFDYDNDGIDEIFAGFNKEINNWQNEYWRLVCYEDNGDTIFTHKENYIDNQLLLGNLFIYKNNEISYIVTSFIKDFVFNCEDDTLIIEIFTIYDFSLVSIYAHTVSFYIPSDIIKINKLSCFNFENMNIIEVGYTLEGFWAPWFEKNTFIAFFTFDGIELNFLDVIDHCGLSIYNHDFIISEGIYEDWETGMWGASSNKDYFLKTISCDTLLTENLVYQVSGHCWANTGSPYNYFDYPIQFIILTSDDSTYQDYGYIIYYKTQNGQEERGVRDITIDQHFLCFTPDFSTILWEKDDTQTGTSDIISSTNISVNNENHYVMYFRENQLEVRDRITGKLVHSDSSSINPFTIKQTSDDELLFFVNTGNEYEVYTVNDIYLGVDDEHLNIANLYQLSNYPNPFRAETTISFNLTKDSTTNLHELIQIKIYNIKGQFVKELGIRISGFEFGEAIWDGNDMNDKPIPSGIYFSSLIIDNKIKDCQKILIIR